jgi:hypothetical protein
LIKSINDSTQILKNYKLNIFKKYKIRVSKGYKVSKKQIFYFNLRKVLFLFLGIVLNLFFNFSNKKPGKNVVILGRGKSTSYFFKNYKKFFKFKSIFFVNFSTEDFPKNFQEIFRKKIIFLFTNIIETIPSIFILSKLVLGKVFIGRCESMKTFNYGRRKSYKCNILYKKFSYLPDKLLKFWWLNNNGLMCICYAANLSNIKNIYLFGFNFYFDSYISKSIKDEVKKADKYHYKQLIHAKYKLKKNFVRLVKCFPKINFHIFIKKNIFKSCPKNLFINIVN